MESLDASSIKLREINTNKSLLNATPANTSDDCAETGTSTTGSSLKLKQKLRRQGYVSAVPSITLTKPVQVHLDMGKLNILNSDNNSNNPINSKRQGFALSREFSKSHEVIPN